VFLLSEGINQIQLHECSACIIIQGRFSVTKTQLGKNLARQKSQGNLTQIRKNSAKTNEKNGVVSGHL
jgi:hypothetical protein